MIKTDLEDGKLKGLISTKVGNNQSFVSKWIFDKRTYQGDNYKLALLLAVAENPDGYGEMKKFPLEDILNASSESELNRLARDWTVKSKEASPTDQQGSGDNSGDSIPSKVEDWIAYLKTAFSKEDVTTVEKLAKSTYKKGTTIGAALKDFTNKLYKIKSQQANNKKSQPAVQEVQA